MINESSNNGQMASEHVITKLNHESISLPPTEINEKDDKNKQTNFPSDNEEMEIENAVAQEQEDNPRESTRLCLPTLTNADQVDSFQIHNPFKMPINAKIMVDAATSMTPNERKNVSMGTSPFQEFHRKGEQMQCTSPNVSAIEPVCQTQNHESFCANLPLQLESLSNVQDKLLSNSNDVDNNDVDNDVKNTKDNTLYEPMELPQIQPSPNKINCTSPHTSEVAIQMPCLLTEEEKTLNLITQTLEIGMPLVEEKQLSLKNQEIQKTQCEKNNSISSKKQSLDASMQKQENLIIKKDDLEEPALCELPSFVGQTPKKIILNASRTMNTVQASETNIPVIDNKENVPTKLKHSNEAIIKSSEEECKKNSHSVPDFSSLWSTKLNEAMDAFEVDVRKALDTKKFSDRKIHRFVETLKLKTSPCMNKVCDAFNKETREMIRIDIDGCAEDLSRVPKDDNYNSEILQHIQTFNKANEILEESVNRKRISLKNKRRTIEKIKRIQQLKMELEKGKEDLLKIGEQVNEFNRQYHQIFLEKLKNK